MERQRATVAHVESFSTSFWATSYGILFAGKLTMKIDRRFEQKRMITRDQSLVLPFFSFFPFLDDKRRGKRWIHVRRGLRGTLCTRYMRPTNSTKTCRRFFDFRRQGRRVRHKSDFVPACRGLRRSRWSADTAYSRCCAQTAPIPPVKPPYKISKLCGSQLRAKGGR